MKEILEQLAEHPGVRMTALVMEDGMPVVVRGRGSPSTPGAGEPPQQDIDALAALSAGWALEVCNAVAPLAWDKPERLALRGADGTLVLRRAHTTWLLVLLAGGLRIEDVLLAMDGTAARVERYVRGLAAEADANREKALPAPLPRKQENRDDDVAQASFKNTEQKSPKGR
jgi:predicted regulator of Ras-like GTPase activity (Roadblock/LC7/MglB family)